MSAWIARMDEEHPTLTTVGLTVFILLVLGIGGAIDAPLIGVTR